MLDSIKVGYRDGIFFPKIYLDFYIFKPDTDNIFICNLLPLIDIDGAVFFDNTIDIYILKKR